jgi:hypothetical protein
MCIQYAVIVLEKTDFVEGEVGFFEEKLINFNGSRMARQKKYLPAVGSPVTFSETARGRHGIT